MPYSREPSFGHRSYRSKAASDGGKLSSMIAHTRFPTMQDLSGGVAIHLCRRGQGGFKISLIFYACFPSSSYFTRP